MLCESNHDDCTPYPCENGGTCEVSRNNWSIGCASVDVDVVSMQDLVGGYECMCEAGWTGDRCQMNIDDCVPIPCLNGGECYVSHYTEDHDMIH